MQLLDGFVERGEERKSGGGDAHGDNAAVCSLARAGREFAFFQTVEQTGNVGVAGNHPVADLGTRQAGRLGATQDAEYVILRRGDTVRFQQVEDLVEMKLGGLLDLDKGTSPGGVEGIRRHTLILIVLTIIAKRNIC